MTAILKLGGSLITNKERRETVDESGLRRVCEMIGSSDISELVIVHGGGSFGHPVAASHNVSTSAGTKDPAAINEISQAMGRLNRAVIEALIEADVNAVSVHTRGVTWKHDQGVSICSGSLSALLQEGFVPVLSGEIVADDGNGCSVVSGDHLAVDIARELAATRIGLCSDVDGVLDANGNVIERIESMDAVESLFSDVAGTDVTGGMAAKVRALLASPVTGAIFGVEDVEAFLQGELPGTTVTSKKADSDTF